MTDKERNELLKLCREAAASAWDMCSPEFDILKDNFLEEYDEEIENLVDNMLAEQENEETERRAADDEKYGSYDDQVRAEYNSSRGV